MPAIDIVLIKGQKAPLYCSVSAASGTLAVAGATFTLYVRGSSTPVSGFNGVSASNSAAGASVSIWYNLDSASLSAGAYVGFFSVPTTSSADANARTEQFDVALYVLPATG